MYNGRLIRAVSSEVHCQHLMTTVSMGCFVPYFPPRQKPDGSLGMEGHRRHLKQKTRALLFPDDVCLIIVFLCTTLVKAKTFRLSLNEARPPPYEAITFFVYCFLVTEITLFFLCVLSSRQKPVDFL